MDPLQSHAVAVACAAVAFVLRVSLDGWVEGVVPFATFYPAVIAAAVLGGYAAGVTATIVSLLLAWFALIEPRWSFVLMARGDVVNLALFIVTAGICILVGGTVRRLLLRLERSEVRMQRAYASAQVGDWEWDLATDRVTWSSSLYALVRRDPARFVPTAGSFLEMIHPEDRARAVEDARAVVAGTTPRLDSEFRVVLPDGRVRWLASRGELVRDSQGRPLRMVGVNFDVTDRREALAASAAERDRARLYFQTAEVMIVAIGADRRVQEINRRGAEILGRPAEEIIGRDWFKEFLPEPLRAEVGEVFAAFMDGRADAPVAYRSPILRADGTVRQISWRNSVIRDGQGLVVGTLSSGEDVTELEEAEAALREGEAKFRALAESTPQLVWSTGPDGRCDYLSRQWIEYTGVPLERQLGLGWLEAVHPDDRARTGELWAAATRGEAEYDLEYRIRGRDGRYRWFKTRGVAVRDAEGRPTRWFGSSTDITEIVEAREALARSNEELELRVAERSRELDRIWRLSQDLFAIIGMDGLLKAVNPAWERVLGRPPRDLLGTPTLDLIHPDDRERTLAERQRQRRGFPTVGFLNRYRHADGSWRWLEWSVVPEGDRLYAVAKDVTARTEAEAALVEANRRLAAEIAQREAAQATLVQAQKMEAVGQLTGGVAHDFNNLLQVILSGLQLLRRDQKPEMRARVEEGLRDAVARGQSLTRQLLAFSRRQSLEPETIDLGRRVAGLSELLARSLRGDIRLELDVPEGIWPLRADPSQLELALLNLAVNARDAMPNGGTLRIEARNATLDGRGGAGVPGGLVGEFVAITVRDTGAGMPPEVLDRVFEPFFTTKAPGKGTGLGLSQVYGFAKQSQGGTAIESRPGEGTAATLYLPRSTEAPEAVEPDAEPSPERDAPAGSGERLLLVEDDDAVAAVTETMLGDLGYRVTRVATGVEALEALEGGSFSLVFSDVMMPGGINGIELARQVAASHPEIGLVLTTGYRDAMSRPPKGVRILSKPYRHDDLAQALRAALPRRERTPPKAAVGG